MITILVKFVLMKLEINPNVIAKRGIIKLLINLSVENVVFNADNAKIAKILVQNALMSIEQCRFANVKMVGLVNLITPYANNVILLNVELVLINKINVYNNVILHVKGVIFGVNVYHVKLNKNL